MGIDKSQVKIVGPSIEPTAAGFEWAVDFYYLVLTNDLRVDVFNMHSFTRTEDG